MVFSAFLLADIDRKGLVKEEAIVIEFPDIIPEPEIIEPETPEQEQNDQAPSQRQINNRTNVASNRMATENTTESTDDFFDEDYLRELEAAQKLASDVSNQLSKEVVDLSDIEMPVENTEGMNPDSIKNVVYAGESNIVYYLDNRHHVELPVPVYLAQGGGTVIVDIKVNRSGRVTEALARKNSKIRDKQVLLYAQEAAKRTIFNLDNSAPVNQKGTIHYTFVAQ